MGLVLNDYVIGEIIFFSATEEKVLWNLKICENKKKWSLNHYRLKLMYVIFVVVFFCCSNEGRCFLGVLKIVPLLKFTFEIGINKRENDLFFLFSLANFRWKKIRFFFRRVCLVLLQKTTHFLTLTLVNTDQLFLHK